MKKLINLFITVIFSISAFCLSAFAAESDYKIIISQHLEQISDNEWFTDSLMINDNPAEVHMQIDFSESALTEQEIFCDSFLAKIENEIRDNYNVTTLYKPEIEATEKNYKVIRTLFRFELYGSEYTGEIYHFYSSSQCCTVRFTSSDGLYFAFSDHTKMINSLSFTDSFYRVSLPAKPAPVTEPETEAETEKTTESDESFAALFADLMERTIFLLAILFFVAIIKKIVMLVKKIISKKNITDRTDPISSTPSYTPVADTDFLMTVEDVFRINNREVAVTGKIEKGTIHINDTVCINNFYYTVTMIDADSKALRFAKAGMHIGLHLFASDTVLFRRGDIVTATNRKAEVNRKEAAQTIPYEKYLDDITFVKEINKSFTAPWYRYDIRLDSRPYGWDNMINWADYMAENDLGNISQVTVATMGTEEKDITFSYETHECKFRLTPELMNERYILTVAGISKELKAPVKIVWFNQSNNIRFLTLCNDSLLMSKYIETVIRRSFGTPDAMKLGKPRE